LRTKDCKTRPTSIPSFPTDAVAPWPGLASKMDPRADGVRALVGLKGAHHRRRFRYWTRGCNRLRPRGRQRCHHYLPNDEPDAKEVIDLIKAAGRVAVAIPGDLWKEKFCQDLVRAIEGLRTRTKTDGSDRDLVHGEGGTIDLSTKPDNRDT
jgi:hypothetical protein